MPGVRAHLGQAIELAGAVEVAQQRDPAQKIAEEDVKLGQVAWLIGVAGGR